MEGPLSFWRYKKHESNLILPEHDDDDEIRGEILLVFALIMKGNIIPNKKSSTHFYIIFFKRICYILSLMWL